MININIRTSTLIAFAVGFAVGFAQKIVVEARKAKVEETKESKEN